MSLVADVAVVARRVFAVLAVVVLIVAIVGLASYLPARRAAMVDPLELLKAE